MIKCRGIPDVQLYLESVIHFAQMQCILTFEISWRTVWSCFCFVSGQESVRQEDGSGGLGGLQGLLPLHLQFSPQERDSRSTDRGLQGVLVLVRLAAAAAAVRGEPEPVLVPAAARQHHQRALLAILPHTRLLQERQAPPQPAESLAQDLQNTVQSPRRSRAAGKKKDFINNQSTKI